MKEVESLSPLERKVLPFLGKYNDVNSLVKVSKLKEVEVMRALQWLQSKKFLSLRKSVKEIISLGDLGERYVNDELPEKKFLGLLPASIIELKNKLDKNEFNVSLGLCKKNKLIKIGKKIEITFDGKKYFSRESLEERFLKKLPLNKNLLSKGEVVAYKNLVKRKNLIKTDLVKTWGFNLTSKGLKALKADLSVNLTERLTSHMLKTGEWEGLKFRKYDLKSVVPRIYPGRRHFVNEAISRAKRIWMDMGFKEMQGGFIHTGFWNFDALFVPQDHPARELQDTFFLKGKGKVLKGNIFNEVKKHHEKGWKYKFSEDEAKRLVLRTHTTVLSALTLSKLKKFPAKYFAIGRNFRNEALDWSHLFEFNQTEGIVVDENANFRDLLGYLKEFAQKMGFKKIRFRPSYYPYTEPSVDGEVYDEKRKKWIELIAAGIFRPEVVIPLLGKDIPVLAWGPGIDRMIMLNYNLKDLREIYKNDLKLLRSIKCQL